MEMTFVNQSGERITLDEDDIASLINTSRIFVHMLEKFYPEVYEEMMQAFDDAAERNSDFKADRNLFVTTLALKRNKNGLYLVKNIKNHREEGEVNDSKDDNSFGKIRKIHS